MGTVAANGEKAIGKMIAEAMKKVGNEGVITVRKPRASIASWKSSKRMQFDRGYLSAYFVTNAEKMTVELEEPFILIHEKARQPAASAARAGGLVQAGKPLLIIAEEVEGEALATLVVNKLRGGLKVAAVKAPGFGDRRKAMLEDIATLTNGHDLRRSRHQARERHARHTRQGQARLITKEHTTIIDGSGKKKDIEARVGQIKAQIEETTSDYDKEKLQEPGEARRRRGDHQGRRRHRGGGEGAQDRVDDALNATRAAVEEGVVPGGGVMLLKAAKAITVRATTRTGTPASTSCARRCNRRSARSRRMPASRARSWSAR